LTIARHQASMRTAATGGQTPMTPDRIDRLESSFAALAPQADRLTELFYDRLFAAHPGVRPLFPEDIAPQRMKLLQSLVTVVENLRDLSAVVPALHALGARHVAYGTQPAHYGAVRDTLLAAMAELAGDLWNETLHDDWTAAIDLVAETMLQGAARAS
jgi:methyl-accepting chemotaxis protein